MTRTTKTPADDEAAASDPEPDKAAPAAADKTVQIRGAVRAADPHHPAQVGVPPT